MSLKGLQSHIVPISERVEDSNRSLHNAWILCAAFNPLEYIKDQHYLQGHASSRIFQKASRRTFNIEFEQDAFPKNSSDLKREGIMMVKRLRNIEPSEEMLVGSSICYIFVALPRAPRF